MNIRTMYAEKLWGRGKLIRLWWRLWCHIVGHQFNDWHYDWPEPWDHHAWGPDGIAESYRTPGLDEKMLWMRGCGRDCGCVQTAECSLQEAHHLPGRAVGPVWERHLEYGGPRL